MAQSQYRACGFGSGFSLSFVMFMISLLLLLAAILLRCRKVARKLEGAAGLLGEVHVGQGYDGIGLVADDISTALPGISRSVVVVLLIYGVMDDAQVSWTGIATIVAVLSIGLAMATTGIAADVLAYVFIRVSGWFMEGELIEVHGETVEVQSIDLRFTICLRNGSPWYIPNKELGFACMNTKSRDTFRNEFKTIALEPNLSPADLEAIVKETWAFLRSMGGDDAEFTALNGDKYPVQVDAASCAVWIADMVPSTSAKEVRQLNLCVKLAGKYWFSKPPPWTDKENPEPKPQARYWDWATPWNYQREVILLEVQKILDRHKPKA